MAYDKVVDSSLLDTNLTIVANAIRSKGGTTENLSFPDGFVSAVQAIQTGGGSGDSSGVIGGSFTPTENVSTIEVDVGTTFRHFVLYTFDTITGQSVKASKFLLVDLDLNECTGVSTNNSGSAMTGAVDVIFNTDGSGTFAIMGNSRITILENGIKISGGTTGNCMGYFLAGVTFNWYAW